jgi:hypothetical protein
MQQSINLIGRLIANNPGESDVGAFAEIQGHMVVSAAAFTMLIVHNILAHHIFRIHNNFRLTQNQRGFGQLS